MEARMKRVCLVLRTCLLLFAVTFVIVSVPVVADHQRGSVRFELLETTIPAIHEAYANDVITPEQLVRMYLKRISAYDKAGPAFKGGSGMIPLNSYIHVNPRAVQDAHDDEGDNDADRGGHDGDSRARMRPLYGVPITLDTNIDTDN